jgi:hypothetical protein
MSEVSLYFRLALDQRQRGGGKFLGRKITLQGYLTYKKMHPLKTLGIGPCLGS